MRIVQTDSNLGNCDIERDILADHDLVVADVATDGELIAACRKADGILVQSRTISADLLDAVPSIRVVVRYGIGLDNIDLKACHARGVTARNVADYCLDEVADHAVACIYGYNRRLTVASRSTAVVGFTTAGFTAPVPPSLDPVGIAGFGRIGRAVAKRLCALNFPVHFWDPYVSDTPAGTHQHDSLVGLATAVRHLTLHMPATDDTQGIVSDTVLRAVGPSGHLVNTGRGALVDEEALWTALEDQALGFASLDVFASEPPVGRSAQLADHSRVLATPHMAYLSTVSLPTLKRRAAEIMRDELNRLEH